MGYTTVWSLYLLLFPLVASLWKPRVRAKERITDLRWPSIAVIVPAQNTARFIARCIWSLRSCNYPVEKVVIYVVADHCADNTAVHARAAGAIVLTRKDGLKGKAAAIDWALSKLTERGVAPDLYLIVDSTVQVEANFFTAMAERWRQGEDIITCHPLVSSEAQVWYARCLGLMIAHRNLQNWARERLGLSVLLDGKGMAYSRVYIQQFGWCLALPSFLHTWHPTEDWRHGVRAVEQGYRVAFAQDARLATSLKASLSEATQQGARWERGRLMNAFSYAPLLLMRGLWQRDWIKIWAALDAIQPPVAVLGIFTLGTIIYMLASGASSVEVAAVIPTTFIGLYVLVVVLWGRREGIGLLTTIWLPLYMIWRSITFVLAWGFFDHFDLGRRR